MIDNTEETSGKSLGISEPGIEGVAGLSLVVSQRDQIVSGAECAGQVENSELEWAKRHVNEEEEKEEEKEKEGEENEKVVPAPQLVERKTELHCADPVPVRKRKGAVGDGAEQRTKTPDPEVVYRNLETAVWGLSSSLLAWKEGMGAVDVYAAKKEQVSKHSHGEYVPRGGFVIKGDRKWFKNIELKMYIGVTESGIECIPARCGKERFISYFQIKPGGVGKGDLSKKLLQLLSEKLSNKEIDGEDILRVLPPGGGELS